MTDFVSDKFREECGVFGVFGNDEASTLTQLIGSTYAGVSVEQPTQTIEVGNHNPLIKNLTVDWNSEKVLLELHPN